MRRLAALLLCIASTLILFCGAARADDAELLTVLESSDWLPEAHVCPADFLPREGFMKVNMKADCSDDPVQCIQLCKDGWAAGCYFVATDYQFKRGFEGYVKSLFLHSCKHGINSGCTNAAAKLDLQEMPTEARYECENMTYEPMCRDGDYWACTMLANNAYKGFGMKRDLGKSIALYNYACFLASDKAVCDLAQSYIDQLEVIKSKEDGDAN